MNNLRAALLFGLTTVVLIVAPVARAQTYYSTETADSIGTLQGWYSTTTGLYTSTDGWWNSANSITTLSNYERVAGDNEYSSVFPNTFTNAQLSANGGHTNFENMYYDDSGWWALAWIEAYDQTGNASYLSMAETIFSYLTGGWTTTECGGGGMNWATNSTYQNAIANELFLDVAAKLYNRTGNATYLSWANEEWNWFKVSGMINSINLINDGLNSVANGCGNNDGTTWTYNQGVILGALVELAQANNDPTLLTEAETIADAVLNPSNGLVNSNGILVENTGTGDNAQFKGVFVRNLMALYQSTRSSAYQSFIDTNADSIWSNDQSTSGYDFGALWQGPYSSADPVAQTSAADAFVAAEAVQGRYPAGPISTTGFGSMQMYAYDGSGNVWVDWQLRGNGGLIAPANWNGWAKMSMGSTVATGAPAVAMDVALRQVVFIPTSSGVSYQSEANSGGSWGSWTAMGGSSGLNNLVAVNDEANGGLYVFGLNSSGTTYYASRANPYASWSNFTSLGGTVRAGYTVAENAQTGYLEVFGVGNNGTVYTNTQTGLTTWSGWTAITGITAQPYLSACQSADGALHIFAIDTNSTAVWTNYQSNAGGSWQSSWQSLGNAATPIQPGFVCSQNANGNLQVFGVGTDGHTYTIWNTGSWTPTWTSLAGVVNPHLVVSSSADGRIVVFGISTGSPYNIYGTWESYPNTYSTWNSWSLWNGGGYKFYAGQP